MAMRRFWRRRRNGNRESSTERSTLLRSRFPSVGRFHLAPDLAAREVARSRVRWRYAIVGVNIHIGGSRSQVLQQGAHRLARQGADELRRVEVSLGQDAVEATAPGRRRRGAPPREQPEQGGGPPGGGPRTGWGPEYVVCFLRHVLFMKSFARPAQ